MCNGVALSVNDVALHFPPFAAKEAHEVLLGKRIVVFCKPTHSLVTADAIDIEGATQVAHHGNIEGHLAQLAACVSIRLE
jgi:hypothetical protein